MPLIAHHMPADQKQTWYFTFGYGHENANGERLGDRYFVVKDATFHEARKTIMDLRGTAWGFQYDDASFSGQPEQFGLKEATAEEIR